jgi:3',5'-cyclic AMP phosphodiesterase CpdA
MAEYRIRVLHLSDLHLGKGGANEVWRTRRVLGDAWLRNLDDIVADGRAVDVVGFTGDVAFSGQPDQYRAALAGSVIADIFQARGELDEALRIRREVQLPVYERLGDVRSLLVGRANLAIGLVQRDGPGDRDEARSLLQWALDAAQKMQLPEAKTIQGILDGMA